MSLIKKWNGCSNTFLQILYSADLSGTRRRSPVEPNGLLGPISPKGVSDWSAGTQPQPVSIFF